MPYRDDSDCGDSDNGDGYQFARPEKARKKKKKSKNKSSARDRKRQLEDQIRSSMQSLNSPVKEKNNDGIAESSPYQSSYQAGGEGTFGGSTTGAAASNIPASNHYSSSRNHVTNAPLPHQDQSNYNTQSFGIMDSLVQCVGTAIRLGTSEISQQPAALYESIRSAVESGTSSSSRGGAAASSFTPCYDQSQGSYQTVDIPSYHQAGSSRPGM
jgi:hypothetical protein